MFRLHLYAALFRVATPAFAKTACDRPHDDSYRECISSGCLDSKLR